MQPVICSFYTKEYTELAARMEKSARSFGFETDIVMIDKINGSWLETIYWRPEFVLQMLKKHERDVIWLDCDAIVEKDPALFRCFEGDFGIHIHERPKRAGLPDVDYLGGTMYFAYNMRVIAFLVNWITLNKTMPKQLLSQWVIPHALELTPELILVELPPEYTQVFDLMRGEGGEPVISHWQASRKFRESS